MGLWEREGVVREGKGEGVSCEGGEGGGKGCKGGGGGGS